MLLEKFNIKARPKINVGTLLQFYDPRKGIKNYPIFPDTLFLCYNFSYLEYSIILPEWLFKEQYVYDWLTNGEDHHFDQVRRFLPHSERNGLIFV